MHRLTFDQEKQLIDYFRDHPSLWNNKDKDYNNRALREQKLDTIASMLQLTRKDVYEKYRNLRTTFFREYKRVTKAATTTSGDNGNTAEKYNSRWRHYKNMLFLTKDNNDPGGSVSMLNEDSTSQHQQHNSLGNSADIDLVEASHLLPTSTVKLVQINPHHNVNSPTEMEMQVDNDGAIYIHSADPALFNNNAAATSRLASTTVSNNNSNNPTNRSYSSSNLSSTSSTSQLITSTGSLLYQNIANIRPKLEQSDGAQPIVLKNISLLTPNVQLATGTNSISFTSPVATTIPAHTTQTSQQPQAQQQQLIITKSIANSQQNHLTVNNTNNSSTPTLVQTIQNQTVPNHSTPMATAHKSSLYFLPASNTTSPTSTTILDTKRVHHVMNNSGTASPAAGLFITNGPNTAIVNTSPQSNNSTVQSTSNNTSSTFNSLNGNIYNSDMREVIKNVVQEAIVDYEDEEMAFCRSLAASLRTLDRSKKDIAKLELQQVIVRYTNPNYCTSLGTSHNGGGGGDTVSNNSQLNNNNSNNQTNDLCNNANSNNTASTRSQRKQKFNSTTTSNTVSTIMTPIGLTSNPSGGGGGERVNSDSQNKERNVDNGDTNGSKT